MSGNLSQYVKIDCAINPSTWAAVATSEYYDMRTFDKAVFIVEAGSMTGSGDVDCSIVQAYNSTGGGSVALGVYSTINGAPADAFTITKALQISLNNASSWVAAQKIVLNDITYTMTSTSYTAGASSGTFDANRYVYSSSAMTNAAGAVEHLAAFINHATYGVPGVTAIVHGIGAASSNNILLTTRGETAMTCVVDTTCVTAIPIKMNSFLECNAIDLASASSFNYIGITVTPSTIQHISATLVRSGGRYSPLNTASVADYSLGVT